jgi:hypothetical protein
MPDDHAPAEEGDEQDDLPISDDLIDEDMPCLRCSYNLRGLRPAGNCPECGAAISKTVAYVMQRVLCPVCFAPNHPSVALCGQCRSPISAAAATADYWRPRAISVRRPKQGDEVEPDPPPLAWMVLCCVFGIICLGCVSSVLVGVWTQEPDPLLPGYMLWVRRFLGTAPLLAVAGLLGAIIYYPSRNYFRHKRDYARKHAAFMAREAEKEKQWLSEQRANAAEVDTDPQEDRETA